MVSDKRWRKMSKAERKASPLKCHRGRRLCSGCYTTTWRAGAQVDFETSVALSDPLLEEATILAFERGLRYRDLPEALGITREALGRALIRAQRQGDPRAKPLRLHNPYTRDEDPI